MLEVVNMNIWIINQTATPPSYGGLVRHYYFSKYLQKDGHAVRIITASKVHNTNVNMIKDNTLYIEKEVDGVEYTFVKTCDYVSNGIKRIYSMLQFPLNTRKLLKKLINSSEVPDVIYASSPSLFSAYATIRFAKHKNIKSVLEIRDLWPESIVAYNNVSKNNPIIKMMYIMEKWMYKNADQLIFTMEGGKDYIIDKGWDKDIDFSKIYSVNNGVDLEEFENNKANVIYEDEDLNSPDLFKVIYMGSVRKAYNISALVDSAKILSEKKKDKIKILVFGDGTEKKELEDRAKEYGLSNIVFKGRVEKKYIANILSHSDLNIVNVAYTELIAKYGCSWNKLFEYFASGKPILSNTPVNFDIIKANNCGTSKIMKTSEEYANEILKYYKMPKEDYDIICDNVRRTSLEYDYKNLTTKIENILEQ